MDKTSSTCLWPNEESGGPVCVALGNRRVEEGNVSNYLGLVIIELKTVLNLHIQQHVVWS